MSRAQRRVSTVVAAVAIGMVGCTDVSPSGCPVTDPASMSYQPSADHPERAPGGDAGLLGDAVWFGDAELFTSLPADGSYEPRKSVWWSENYQGPDVEPTPDLTVTYERLNSHAEPVVFAAPGTHGTTRESGTFMVNGRDPETPGCWRVTAEYGDASLSYTYETGVG